MTRQEILIVEDEGITATDLQCRLEKLEYNVTGIASSSEEALQSISRCKPDLILMDIGLKGDSDGIQTASAIREKVDVPIVFMTGMMDDELLERAKAVEPYGYLLKPVEDGGLHSLLQIAHFKHKAEQERGKRFSEQSELLQQLLAGCVKALGDVLAGVAPQLHALGEKQREYMAMYARALGITDTWDLEVAAALSHIGYLQVPSTLIQKERAGLSLTPAEREVLNRVPEFGRNILRKLPQLEAVAQIVYYQMKNFDGTGFPVDSMAGVRLPQGSRMLRIIMDLLHLESTGTPRSKISDQMTKEKGKHDPTLLRQAIAALIDAPPPGSVAVKLKDLYVGQELMAPIETSEGTVLVGTGSKITQVLLNKINNFAETLSIREPIYVQAAGQSR